MDYLIDRDALMKEICDNECGSVCDEECENAMCNFYDYIMEAPAVNRWIPCSERLPETGKCVLACVNGALEKFSVTAYLDNDCDWISDYCGDVIDREITHWMTLPEPPEEEKKL